MTTSTVQYTEERVKVAGTELYMLRGGSGSPVLVLHGVEGFEGWLPFHEALAAQATVYAPAHPGYGQTPCPEWVETIPHQAVFYHWFLQEQALAPVDVVGIGIGGWIAAQMAVMCPQYIRHLVLVDAAGIGREPWRRAARTTLPPTRLRARGAHRRPRSAARSRRWLRWPRAAARRTCIPPAIRLRPQRPTFPALETQLTAR